MAKQKHDCYSRRIQIFPRSHVFEILNGEALSKGMIGKMGAPLDQKVLNDILEHHCYTILTEAQRKKYREMYKDFADKKTKLK